MCDVKAGCRHQGNFWVLSSDGANLIACGQHLAAAVIRVQPLYDEAPGTKFPTITVKRRRLINGVSSWSEWV